MHLRTIIFILLIGSNILFAHAQNVTLQIQTEGLSNSKLRVYRFLDFVSYMPEYLYNKQMEGNSTKVGIEVSEATFIRIVCGDIEKEMVAEPGKNYNLTIKNDSSLAPIFSNELSSQDINLLIQKLNTLFNDFLFTNQRKILEGKASNDVKTFIVNVRNEFSAVNHSYFSLYLQSKLGELEMFARTKGTASIMKNYLWNRPIPFYHYEYMYLFNELMGDQLKEISTTKLGVTLNTVIRKYQKFSKLDSLLLIAQPSLIEPEFRHAVLLTSLSNLYKEKGYDKPAILYQIQQARTEGCNDEIRKIAERLYQRLNKPYEGKEASNILMTKEDNLPVAMYDLLDKPLYIVLFQAGSDVALRDISAMPELIKNFSKNFNFACLAVDMTQGEISKMIKTYKFKFPIYTLQNSESLQHYPMDANLQAYLVGTDRRFLKVNLQGPSNGADIVLHSLVRN